jgi:Rieske Fe-S protein
MAPESLHDQLERVAAHLPEASPTSLATIEHRARARRRRRITTRAVAVAAGVAVAFVVVPSLFDRPGPSGVEIVGGPADLVPVESGWPQVRGSTQVFPLVSIEQGTTSGTIEDRQVFFVRDGDDIEVFIAAAQHLPDEGLWWCPDEQLFASPAHGELFDTAGRARRGPASRDLDRFATDVRDGNLHVDAAQVIIGPPARTSSNDEQGTRRDDRLLTADAERAYDRPWNEGFCLGHQPDLETPRVLSPDIGMAAQPAGARPSDPTQIPQELRELFAIDDDTAVMVVPVPATRDRAVFATPETDPPLMVATDCDLLAATPLPEGWLGYCLERTNQGQRTSSLYPYGTTSHRTNGD